MRAAFRGNNNIAEMLICHGGNVDLNDKVVIEIKMMPK